VIDPWNEIEALHPAHVSETEHISQSLKKIRVFARERDIHVWIVVHPQKLYRADDGKYPVPTLYDCHGSAHWRNKADNGIVVWRDLSGQDSDEVEIHVQKVRFRQIGQRGKAVLYYNRTCATYLDSEGRRGYDRD
jgi:twinkle protein